MTFRVIFGLTVLFLLGSCQPPVPSGNTPLGSLAVSVEAPSVRSVLPATPAPDKYRLTATGPVGAAAVTPMENNTTGTFTLPGLAYGDWTITIKGYTNAAATAGYLAGSEFLSGSTTVTINSASTTASVALTPFSGNGSLAITVSWPSGTPVTGMSGTVTPVTNLASWTTGTAIPLATNLFAVDSGTNTATLSTPYSPLATGTYLLSLTAKNGTTVVASNSMETLVIYNGQTSTWTASIVAGQIKSSAKLITAFTMANATETSTATSINDALGTISITMPYGALRDSLTPTITTSVQATVSPLSNVATNDHAAETAVNYTVTAADGSTKTYAVTVSNALNPAKDITAFSFVPGLGGNPSTTVTATIDQTAKTIKATLPDGSSLTNLVATFTNTGSLVSVGGNTQGSGSSSQNFTNPVTYRVTAADGSTKDYEATITVLTPLFLGVYYQNSFTASAFKFDLTSKVLSSAGTHTTGTNTYNGISVDPTGSFAAATGNTFAPSPLVISKTTGALSAAGSTTTLALAMTSPLYFDASGTRAFGFSGMTATYNFNMYSTSPTSTWTNKTSAIITDGSLDAFAVAPSGNYVFGAYKDGPSNTAGTWGSVYALAVNTGGVINGILGSRQTFGGQVGGPLSLVVDPKERFVFAAGRDLDRTVTVYSLASTGISRIQSFQVGSAGTDRYPMDIPAQSPLCTNPMVIDPTGKYLYIVGKTTAPEYLAQAYPIGNSVVDTATPWSTSFGTEPVYSLSFNRSGTLAYVVTQNSTANTWKLRRYTVGTHGELTSPTTVLDVSATQNGMPVVDPSGAFAVVMNASTGMVPETLKVYDTTNGAVLSSPSISGLAASIFPRLTFAPIYP